MTTVKVRYDNYVSHYRKIYLRILRKNSFMSNFCVVVLTSRRRTLTTPTKHHHDPPPTPEVRKERLIRERED